ncbi:unnamed protein product [Trichobilharzia regenti]|nr:unnamed protein product [Trichobilharzia regenti]
MALWNSTFHLHFLGSSTGADQLSKPNLTDQIISDIDQLSGDTDISDDYDDDCLEDDIYHSFPGPLINDSVCSFVATQKMFVDQHWYHCFTCNLQESHGVCSICAKVCHLGHDLSYAKYSGFFCDCGAGQHGDSVCQAITPRIVLNKDALPDSTMHQGDDIFLQCMNKNELNYYLPWLTDGYQPFISPPTLSKELSYPCNRSSVVTVDDHRSNGVSAVETQASKLVKRRRKESLQCSETRDNKTGVSDTNTDSLPRFPLSHQATSSTSNRSNTLRRTGAVRLRKISSDVHSNTGILKTLQMNQQQTKLSIAQHHRPNQQDMLSTNQYSYNTDNLPCKPSVVVPTSLTMTTTASHQEDYKPESKRIRNIHHFLNLFDKYNCHAATVMPTATKGKRKYSKHATTTTGDDNNDEADLLQANVHRFQYCQLVPNEAKLIEFMRNQIDSDETGSCRSKLMMMLCTSDVVSQAAEILMGFSKPDTKSLLSHLMNCSTVSEIEFTGKSRLDKLNEMLSSERNTTPTIHMCSNITTPVPAMPTKTRSLWRNIFIAGRQIFRSKSPYSTCDINEYLMRYSSTDRLSRTCDEADHGVVTKSIQSSTSTRHTPTSTDHISYSVVSPGRIVVHSLSDNSNSGVSSCFSPSSLSTTPPIDAIVSLPALSMSTASNASRGTSSSSNPVLLIQALASIFASTDSSNTGGGLFLSGGNTSATPDANGTAVSFLPSNAALSLRELFGPRMSNNMSSSTAPVAAKTSSSVTGAAASSGATTCVVRVPCPGQSKCSYFLVVTNTGPKSVVAGSDTGANTTTTSASDTLKGSRSPFGHRGLMTIYCLDKLLIKLADKQDRSLKEIAKLRAITALLQSRHDESIIGSDNETNGKNIK